MDWAHISWKETHYTKNGYRKKVEDKRRTKQIMLYWMLKGVYGKHKEEAQHREKWPHRPFEPA